MLTDANVMTFVATAKPEEARTFYEGVLGLTLVEDSPFALVLSGLGGDEPPHPRLLALGGL